MLNVPRFLPFSSGHHNGSAPAKVYTDATLDVVYMARCASISPRPNATALPDFFSLHAVHRGCG
ncbi:hypothetical protein PUN4_80063 [Paraburkholderia unamae]|nr:hypothetical protein PUN4_80063 [Paraburkholderia unamae]